MRFSQQRETIKNVVRGTNSHPTAEWVYTQTKKVIPNISLGTVYRNLKTLQESIDRNKPSGAKGRYWKSLYVTSTMGPSVEVDVTALQDIEQET